MQFTPQQLSGAGKYNNGVRIGNWNEDVVLDEIRSKSRAYHKTRGNREIDINSRGTKIQVEPVFGDELPKGEGLKFGQFIVLEHAVTTNVLASNIAQEQFSTQPGCSKFQVSVSPDKTSMLRNVFQVESVTAEFGNGDPVCFGDELYFKTVKELRINPSTGIVQKQLFLNSTIESINSATEQTVTFSLSDGTSANQYIRWKFLPTQASSESMRRCRFPVKFGEHVQVVHCASGKSLFSTPKNLLLNNFGQEYRVLCDRHIKKHRTHVLHAECHGLRDGDHVVSVLENNWWKISGFESISTNLNSLEMNLENILQVLHDDLSAIGKEEIIAFLHEVDETKDGIIRKADFMWGLLHCGCRLSDDELYFLANSIADSNDGISIESFQKLIDE